MLTPDRALDRDELDRSCVLANQFRARFTSDALSVVTTLLIDDKRVDSAVRRKRGSELMTYLSQFTAIDYYCYERDLAAYVESMLACLTPRVRRSRREAIDRQRANGSETLACSIDVTIWHLLRLGIWEDTQRILRPLQATEAYSGSEVAVSVLPDHLGAPENAARRILKHLDRDRSVDDRIFPLFFPTGPITAFTMRQLEHKVDDAASVILDTVLAMRHPLRAKGFAIPALASA